jgi:hypothetical protein
LRADKPQIKHAFGGKRHAAGPDVREAEMNKAVVKIAVCMSKRKKARRLVTGLHLSVRM